MDSFSLNNIDLGSFGIIAGQHSDSDLAITGAWDMPARIGKCFHNWGNSVEPYVLAEEIRFGGRDILFRGLVEANGRMGALDKLFGFYRFLDGLKSAVELKSPEFGIWKVFVNGKTTVEYLDNGWCTIDIPFREPIVDLSGDLPVNSPQSIAQEELGIDSIRFSSLGLTILSTDGDFDRPAPLSGEAVAYSHEPYQITAPGFREINIRALIQEPDYASFKRVLKGLYALFKKPGLRWITKKEDALRDFFVMDGFQVSQVRAYDQEVTAILNIKLHEVAAHLEWNNLANNAGTEIITDLGNKFIIT